MPRNSRALAAIPVAATLLLVALATPALASSGGGLPWEGPLQQIQQSITGPVAGFIALAAVAVAHAARRRASEALADAPHRRRAPSYPADRMSDLYGS